jgi:D-lactate dehydrogenase
LKKHEVLDQLAQQGLTREQLRQSSARSVVWSRDASHFKIQPETTMRARSIAEVSQILAAATKTNTFVTFRSGGSSLSGQTLGTGLVVDVRSGFQKIIEIGEDRVTSQPGVTLSRLNGHMLSSGRKMGPDPASLVSSTLGGAVSNNSSGMTCGVKFNSYATILGAKIVFADGVIFDTMATGASQTLIDLKPELFKLLEAKRDQIRTTPKLAADLRRLFTLKNTMGYSLNAFLDHDDPVDILTHLMVGSEGTLGFLGEVTMRTLNILPLKATNLLIFESLEFANQTLMKIIAQEPVAVELMDRTSLEALDSQGLLPAELKERMGPRSAAVLVEFEAADQAQLDSATANFSKSFSQELVFDAVTDQGLRNKLWAMRKNLYAIVAKARPQGTTALLEDVSVPPEKLTETCLRISELCELHGYGAPVIFGHVKDGNIHFMISDDFSRAPRIRAFEEFTNAMVDLVLNTGGNLKAEHGTGRAMAPFVEAQFGSDLYKIIQEIKHGFDPDGILNPGVIIPESQSAYLENLKTVTLVDEIVDSCVECGYCESSCPSSGLTLTPRERIVAFRELEAQSPKDRKQLAKELHYQADQSCATDGMCAVNCPVGINTGTFVKQLRAKGQSSQTQKLGLLMQAIWGRLATLVGGGLRVAGKIPSIAESASRLLARMSPKGIFPTWSANVVGQGFRRSKLESTTSNLFTYLPSCMNEMFGDPAIPEVLKIAKEHGVGLSLADDSGKFCCGTPFSSKGLTKAFEKATTQNKKLMHSLAGQQLVIDGSSCHQTLLDQSDVKILEIGQFVLENLLDMPVRNKHPKIILHPTCSGEATGSNLAMEKIARHIAEEVVVPIDWKCCGFAGDRGLLIPELTAHATLQEAVEVQGLEGLFVSNNQPCQIGMSGATDKAYISIIEAWLRSVR